MKMPEPTMEHIANRAAERAQEMLDRARRGLAEAEKALREIARSPVFGNGIAKGLKDSHKTTQELDTQLENLKVRIGEHFRGEDLQERVEP